MLTPSGSGTAAAPIVLGAYGSGARPVVAGGGTRNASATVLLSNLEYWTLQDLTITNHGAAKSTKSYRSGLLFWNTGSGRLRGLTAQRLMIRDVVSNLSYSGGNPREWGGLVALATGPTGGGFDDMTLRGNTVSKVGRTGIAVINHRYGSSADRRLRVTGNAVRDVRGDGILIFGTAKAHIDHNLVARASSLFPCAQCEKISRLTASAGIWPAQSTDTIIEYNEVYGTRVANGDGEGFDIDASAKNTILQYNYAHDNAGGGVLFCGSIGAVARFNLFENNTKSVIAFIGSMPAKSTSIYNNTIYQSSGTDAGVVRYFNGAKGNGIRFFNNIVFSYGRSFYMWPTKVWSRSNTYVGKHRSGEPHGSSYSWRDPQLRKAGSGKVGFSTLSGYKPKHPASIQRGKPISKSITRDFFGKRINPQRPPRGAAA